MVIWSGSDYLFASQNSREFYAYHSPGHIRVFVYTICSYGQIALLLRWFAAFTYYVAQSVTPPYECPGYDTKQSDGEAQVMLELRGMQSTPSLPSLPGPLWPEVVAPDKGPIYGSNRTEMRTYAKLNYLK